MDREIQHTLMEVGVSTLFFSGIMLTNLQVSL
jgi:hypothetical protein